MELRCFIPTTGYTGIVVKYALESSSTASGDSVDVFDYSVDSGKTWKNGLANGMKVNGRSFDTISTIPPVYQGTSWGLVSVDLSADKSVENNPNLIFRIRFKGNTSLAKGNNRLDNFTVEGFGSGGSGPAPYITVQAPVAHDTLVVGQHKTITFFPIGAVSSKRYIEFSSDSAKTWSPVYTIIEGTSYNWTVPDTLTGKGFIRVRDTANVIGKSGMFAIVNPGSVLSVAVGTTPGKVQTSDSVQIAWTTSGYLGATVNIDLSLDNKTTWTPIKAALAIKTISQFGWRVPSAEHTGAIVRLTFASGAIGYSDPFDITAPSQGVSLSDELQSVRVWPNPFDKTTTISYGLSEAAPVEFALYDLTGVEVLHNDIGIRPQGDGTITIDGSTLPDGTYVFVLTTGRARHTGKVLIAH
jgi:hypothetical protein